jgi:hypothetical protein
MDKLSLLQKTHSLFERISAQKLRLATIRRVIVDEPNSLETLTVSIKYDPKNLQDMINLKRVFLHAAKLRGKKNLQGVNLKTLPWNGESLADAMDRVEKNRAKGDSPAIAPFVAFHETLIPGKRLTQIGRITLESKKFPEHLGGKEYLEVKINLLRVPKKTHQILGIGLATEAEVSGYRREQEFHEHFRPRASKPL